MTAPVPDVGFAVGPVCDALRRSHRELATLAATLPTADAIRRSFCTGWTVAQVFSHLGSGAEIESARIRAGLAGAAEPDPAGFWERWNALGPDRMVGEFTAADAGYLQLLDGLDFDEVGHVPIAMDRGRFRVPLRVAIVLRLAEHALHSWDIRVTFDPAAEVDPAAADLLLDLYPRQIISMVGTSQAGGRWGNALLRFDIADPRRTLLLRLGELVTLESVEPGSDADSVATSAGQPPTGHIGLPHAGAWARLLTGRLDPDHMPPGVTSTGRPTLAELDAAFGENRGDRLAGDGNRPA